MKLQYVGDLPSVSKRGVGFDKSKPDKYNFLQPAVERIPIESVRLNVKNRLEEKWNFEYNFMLP